MRGEVVADFRQTYGIDLPLGGGFDGATDEDLCRWQVLYSQLPARGAPFALSPTTCGTTRRACST